MPEFYLPTYEPKRNAAQIKVIALRAAHKMCYKRLLRKMRKYGKVMTEVTIIHNPDWDSDSERAAVDAAIREERRK